MPVTRHELRKQYEQNHKNVIETMIQSTFNSICDEVTTSNNYGNTSHKVDFTYRAYWNQSLVDRVMELLKNHYTDTHIYSCNKIIYMTWTFMDHFADKTDMVADSSTNNTENIVEALSSYVPAVDVQSLDDDKNIQINITLPSRVTRSSSRK